MRQEKIQKVVHETESDWETGKVPGDMPKAVSFQSCPVTDMLNSKTKSSLYKRDSDA